MSTTNCVTTLYDLVRSGCEHSPAISAPGRKPLTFSNLCTLIDHTIADLHERGIGIGSRVAIVLPNGPEMATAFIAVACAATAAPLNPAYTESEFAFYLADLDIELLIVAEGESSPSIAVAAEQGIAIARLHAMPEAGAGTLRPIEAPAWDASALAMIVDPPARKYPSTNGFRSRRCSRKKARSSISVP